MKDLFNPVVADLGLIHHDFNVEQFRGGTKGYDGYQRKESYYMKDWNRDVYALGVILAQIEFGD